MQICHLQNFSFAELTKKKIFFFFYLFRNHVIFVSCRLKVDNSYLIKNMLISVVFLVSKIVNHSENIIGKIN